MFTGIIQYVGKVSGILKRRGVTKLKVATGHDLSGTRPGESIAVNGACLTITSVTRSSFEAEISPETLALTNLGFLRTGDEVNLEWPLTLATPLGGHLVIGHVEGTAFLKRRAPLGEAVEMWFSTSSQLARYIVNKGSVALDGISLTVNVCRGNDFSVAVIPHTLKVTTLGARRPGAALNIETDIIGKYVEKFLAVGGPAIAPGITEEDLKGAGFL